jgi:DNA-binding NarL/FixJ family response regulator
MSGPIRVVVVDDHPVFRSGLRALVEECAELEFVAEASDGDQAAALCDRHQPDVVMMDIRMPGTSGVESTRRIVTAHPSIGVLMLTMLEDDTSMFAALRAGARGYVLKGATPDEIIRAIVAVAAGEALFGSAVARRIATFLQPDQRTRDHPYPSLSPRERDILELIAAGLTNTAIAARLALSEKTVRNNVSTIFTKLRTGGRAETIVKAREAGLGQADP